MNYIHNEHLRKADESYEVIHDNKGKALHVYIKDGDAIIFNSLHDLVSYVYFAKPDIQRHYVSEDELEGYYQSAFASKAKARWWVIKYGADCDGVSSAGVVPFELYADALKYAEDSTFWSDGTIYNLTEDWQVVCAYCEDYMLNSNNYKYA